MSNNTNTLFWVITGAVIVLAGFMFVNSLNDGAITNITHKFSSLWTNEELDDYYSPIERVVYKDYYKENSNRFYCRKNGEQIEKDGIHVEVLNMQVYDDGRAGFKWILTNKSGKVHNRIQFNLLLYDCETNYVINNIGWMEDRFEINEKIDLTTSMNAPTREWQYYIDVEYRYY